MLTHGMSCSKFLKQEEVKHNKFKGAATKNNLEKLTVTQQTSVRTSLWCSYTQATKATLWGFAEHPFLTPVTAHLPQPPCPCKGSTECGAAGCNLSCRTSTFSSRQDRGKEPGKLNKTLGNGEQTTELRSSVISLLYNSYTASLRLLVVIATRTHTHTYIHTRFFIVLFAMKNQILYFNYYSFVQFKLALSYHSRKICARKNDSFTIHF